MADERMVKPEAEWRRALTEEQYRITREKGTERAFSGCLWNEERAGRYRCVCCGQLLFESGTKYDSGSGWPSFFAPVADDVVKVEVDRSHGRVRDEVMCSRCDAHLGHRFPDGPPPSGTRYCINSGALHFEEG